MDPEKSPFLKVAVVVLVAAGVVGAGYLALRRPGSEQPSSAAAAQPYVCLEDGHVFSLTPAEFDERLRRREARSTDEDGQRGGPIKVKCDQCGQLSAVIAAKCPQDGSAIPIRDKMGQPGRCPKCGGTAAP